MNREPYQQKALDLFSSGVNIALYGPGGCGKSFTLEEIINSGKRVLALAPTGKAALNLHETAMTIHSFLSIGASSLNAHNWEKVKKKIRKVKNNIINKLKEYDVIVIDEFTMIYGGLLDTFCKMLLEFTGYLWGNKQIILSFDCLQLQPIKPKELYEYTAEKLEGVDYVLNTDNFQRLIPFENIIYFDNNRRTKNLYFNTLLLNARLGNLNSDDLIYLNKRTISNVLEADSKFGENMLYTSLKNQDCIEWNTHKLNSILKPIYEFDREIICSEDDFYSKFDNKDELKKIKLYNECIKYMDELGGYTSNFKYKVGARVMCRTNIYKDNKIINGSLGEIVEIKDNIIFVQYDNGITIEHELINWEHPDHGKLIRAYPLILAWGITTHKLQGSTIKDVKLVVNTGMSRNGSYMSHLLYVAISRVNDPENLYIISDDSITNKFFPVDNNMFKWHTNYYNYLYKLL